MLWGLKLCARFFVSFAIEFALSRCSIADSCHCMSPANWTGEDDDAALLQGDQPALSTARRFELFVESRERLTRLALHLLGNIEDAQDLVQEVGLRVLRHPTGPRDEACFQAWCKGLVRNGVADYRRTAGRRPIEFVGLGIDDYCSRLTPVDPMLTLERRAHLTKHLGDLDTGSRQVLMRRYVLGQTATEIASDTNSSPAGVRMKLKRLRTRLKRLLPHLVALVSMLGSEINLG
jgi:RNA polymerase sigma-70 factor (ECF subfamily)